MKVERISFTGTYDKISRSTDRIYLSNLKELSKNTSNVDVFLSSSTKEYPYLKHNGTLDVPCIKISVVPKGLNFIQRMFTDKRYVTYFPTGNMRELIGYKENFDDVFLRIVGLFKENFKLK